MAMGYEERKARIRYLNDLLTNNREELTSRAMLKARLEMYSLSYKKLMIDQIQLKQDILDIKEHRTVAIRAGCDDDLLERANTLLWRCCAMDMSMEKDIETFGGFIKELKEEGE